MSHRLRISRRRFSAALAPTVLLIGSLARGQEPSEQRRAKLLAEMRSLAEETNVRIDRTKSVEPELIKTPVFRYDDQPRQFIDATLWAWTYEGRPVAFQKVEAMEFGAGKTTRRWWQFCFASVSTDLVEVKWSQGRTFRSTEPGLTLQAFSDAPPVAAENAQRKRQARELVRKFSARIVTNPKDNTTQEMRLLTTPIFHYEDSKTKELQGAVFALSTNGTNPDVLLVLEVRGAKEGPAWHFAPVRMTSGAVTLTYQGRKVWETEWLDAKEGPFPTWMNFVAPREAVAGEGSHQP